MAGSAKNRFYFFMVIVLISVLFSSVSCSLKKLTEVDNNTSIKLKLDETLKISLDSNPTTGYDWSIGEGTDLNIVSVILDEYKPSASKLTGSGGVHIYEFKAVATGKTSIILNYSRTWETDTTPINIFTININIE